MKSVAAITRVLSDISGAISDPIPPEQTARENEPGVIRYTLHQPDMRSAAGVFDAELMPHDNAVPESPLEFEPVFEWGSEQERVMGTLARNASGDLLKSVEIKEGMDALGWYVPFHHRGPQWGAYISLSGVAVLAQHVFGSLQTSDETRFRLAFHAILQHELFHFATEAAIAQVELLIDAALYLPAQRKLKEDGARYHEVEEKLANAWMLRTFRTNLPAYRVSGKQAALRDFAQKQPAGYRDALAVKTIEDWDAGYDDLAFGYVSRTDHCDGFLHLWESDAYDWTRAFPVHPRINWRHCAIHLVDDSTRYGIPAGWIPFFPNIPSIIEDEQFEKQLVSLATEARKGWRKVKTMMQATLQARGLNFKRWPKGGDNVYSVRINDKVRAHLRLDKATHEWRAVAIGGHKELGHG
jgi:hypothetical protein